MMQVVRPFSTCRPSLQAIALAAVLLLIGAAPAPAARPVVATPGGGEVELGDAHVDVIDFLVLQRGERYTATVSGTPGDPVRVRLYVPDRRPEEALPARLLPLVTVGPFSGAAALSTTLKPGTEGTRLKEASTGVRLIEVVDSDGAPGASLEVPDSGQVAITVEARAAIRVALQVGPERGLVIPDAARQPRTIARLRQWYDIAADGSPSTRGAPAKVPNRRWLVVPAAVVASMLALAVWWVLLGSTVGRKRSERRAAQNPDRPSDD